MATDAAPPGPGRIDSRRLRDALGRFATGVTVVTTRGPDGRLEGLTANSFSAVSLDPPLVLWSLKRNSQALANFQRSGFFAVNVLAASRTDLSHRFATPAADKYAGVEATPGLGGCPLLPDPLAVFECATERQIDGRDHVIFVGRVHRLALRDGEPLTFNQGRYCTALPLRRGQAQSDLEEIWAGLG